MAASLAMTQPTIPQPRLSPPATEWDLPAPRRPIPGPGPPPLPWWNQVRLKARWERIREVVAAAPRRQARLSRQVPRPATGAFAVGSHRSRRRRGGADRTLQPRAVRHGAPVRGIQEVLGILARGFAASQPPGRAVILQGLRNVAGGKAGARPPPLAGIPAHSLPIFGQRSRGCPGMSRRPYS